LIFQVFDSEGIDSILMKNQVSSFTTFSWRFQ